MSWELVGQIVALVLAVGVLWAIIRLGIRAELADVKADIAAMKVSIEHLDRDVQAVASKAHEHP